MNKQPSNSMSVFRSIAAIPTDFGPCVAAIGNFDGVHLGHRDVLSAIVREARDTNTRSIAITFDPHPERFLRPSKTTQLLTPIDERLRLLAATGIDAALVLPFDAELAGLSAHEFVSSILVRILKVQSLHEGGNFRFGKQAEAGVAELEQFGSEMGFATHVHAPVFTHNLEVSSSAIRAFIAAGDMRHARWMLGRPFAIRSTHARGRGIGTKLVVPTINIAPYDELLPAFGVYVTRMTVGERTFQAVTNIGNRPTFGEPSFAVESYILNFEPVDLNDQTEIELQFLLRLRGEIAWPSPEALKAQIFRDVAKAKRYFHLCNLLRTKN